MKRLILLLLTALMIISLAACKDQAPKKDGDPGTETSGTDESLQEDGDYFTMTLDSDGWDIFTPQASTGYAYRYGPSIIQNEDGSMDAWFSCMGNNKAGELDYISYKRSEDNGQTWTNEKIVLSPTGFAKDRLSCCDPGVIKFGGYYYIGYTSTLDKAGYSNHVFVARSENPDGPYEKWNGAGWGGYPEPLIRYDGHGDQWGIGEVSFVAVEEKLYVYYSLKCETGQYTMVAEADATDENWPATLHNHGVALVMGYGQAAADVKYDRATDKFIAAAIVNGFSTENYMALFTSDDGRNFTETSRSCSNLYTYAMNNGISAGPDCTFDSKKDKLYVAYAYGEEWGCWATRMAPVTLRTTNNIDLTADTGKPIDRSFEPKETERYNIGVSTDSHYYVTNVGGSFTVGGYVYNDKLGREVIADVENMVFSDYDESVVSFNGTTGTALAAGRTMVRMTYRDEFYVTFTVEVKEAGVDISSAEVCEWSPWVSELRVSRAPLHATMIKGVALTCAGQIGEAYNDPLDKAIFTPADYPVTYSGYDPSIIFVDDMGVITPLNKGRTIVTVTIDGGLSFDVSVAVID